MLRLLLLVVANLSKIESGLKSLILLSIKILTD